MKRFAALVFGFLLLALASADWANTIAEAAGGTVAENRTLLQTHRPVLRYDADERYFAQPIDVHAGAQEGDRVYGHLAREGDTRWLQYWFFYAYNPQDRGILRTGRHQGDWEFLQLRVGAEGRPDLGTLAQHTWAEGCEWTDFELTRIGGNDVPIVYVANGSHAIYSRAGTHDRPWPDPNDEADGRGRAARPQLTVIDDGSPAWVERAERWGGSRAGIVPAEESSPPGPKFQADGRWLSPATFHEERARPCGSEPPGRLWLTAALAAVVAALAFALLAVRRRRRTR